MAKLFFNYAAMNAGKSTMLLQASFNYLERGMQTMEFTAKIDDRNAVGAISSRLGINKDAVLFDAETDLFQAVSDRRKAQPVDCAFLDEAQFLKEAQVLQLARIVDELKIPVVCYGLRTDFQARLFEGSAMLLALADEIRELKTICHCGSKAIMNMRIDVDGNAVTKGASIEIGGNDRYTSMCRKHFFEAVRKSEQFPS